MCTHRTHLRLQLLGRCPTALFCLHFLRMNISEINNNNILIGAHALVLQIYMHIVRCTSSPLLRHPKAMEEAQHPPIFVSLAARSPARPHAHRKKWGGPNEPKAVSGGTKVQ